MKSNVKISVKDLLNKLQQIDERLVNIWITEAEVMDDDDVWEIFVVLLETRVELLKTCRDIGVKLDKETCLPAWLERLVTKRKDLKLRELRALSDQIKRRRKISSYARVAGEDGEADR